jgi:hypothetical protein
VPDRGGQGEESLGDTGVESGGGAGAVGFEGKLSFAGVVDRFDELADAAEISDLALTPPEFDDLLAELTPAHQARTPTRASGRKPATSFADRVAITLQRQRFSTPTHVLAELVGVSTTAILKALKHTRPLLDDSGHTPEPTGTTLNTATQTREFATRTSRHTAT